MSSGPSDVRARGACRAVTMRLLLQPEHVGQAERHFDATRAALKYYGEWFGPYPYGHITIDRSGLAERRRTAWNIRRSSPPARAGWRRARSPSPKASRSTRPATSSGTASSPTTSSSTRGWTKGSTPSRPRGRSSRSSSRNYYVEALLRRVHALGLPRPPAAAAPPTATAWPATGAAATPTRQSTPTWRYWPGTAGAITYNKTALWLQHARADARLGHAAADPVDLLRALGVQASRAAGFLRGRQRGQRPGSHLVLRSGLSQLERVRLRRRRVHERARDATAATSATASRQTFSAERAAPAIVYRTTVVVRRYGDGVFPVDVRVVFENNEEVRWQWDGRERWKLFEVDRPVRAVYAQVDPERVLLLDVNYTNNTRDARRRRRDARRAQVVAHLAGLAAGSPADLRVLRLSWRAMTACRSRDGIRRVNGAPMVLAGMFARDAARRAAAGARAARHDRGAPRRQPGRRRRGGGHELRLVAGVLGAGDRASARPSCRRSSASAPCSTTSSGLLDNQPLAATIAGATAAWLVRLVVPVAAASSIATRAAGRRASHGFFAACGTHFWRFAAARRRSPGSSTAFLFAVVHPWLFDDALPVADARHDGRAHGVRDPAGLLRGLRRAARARATWSSTTRASASSSRIAAARSARCWPARGSCAAIAARLLASTC